MKPNKRGPIIRRKKKRVYKRRPPYKFASLEDMPKGARYSPTPDGFQLSCPLAIAHRLVGILLVPCVGMIGAIAYFFPYDGPIGMDIFCAALFVVPAAIGMVYAFWRVFGREGVEAEGVRLTHRRNIGPLAWKKTFDLDRVRKVRLATGGIVTATDEEDYESIRTKMVVVETLRDEMQIGAFMKSQHCNYLHYVLVDYMRKWTKANREGALTHSGAIASHP